MSITCPTVAPANAEAPANSGRIAVISVASSSRPSATAISANSPAKDFVHDII